MLMNVAVVHALTDVLCNTNLDFINWMVDHADGWDVWC